MSNEPMTNGPKTNEFELDSLMKKMADGHQPELPSPGLIWWRAQILRKQQEKERVERPLVMMRLIAAAACLVGFLVLLAGNWGEFQVVIGHNNWLLMPLGITVLAVVSLVSVVLLFRSPAKQ
jgi:hypothetical protein